MVLLRAPFPRDRCSMNAGEVVRQIYETRKRRNPTYSLRAFARDSGVGVTLLSRVFAAKVPFTFKQALRLKGRLRLTANEADRLFTAFDSDLGTGKNRAPAPAPIPTPRYADPGFQTVDDVPFELGWREMAILALAWLPEFRGDIVRVGRRLGLRPAEVAESLEYLLEKNLLVERDGKFSPRHRKMLFDRELSMAHVRRFHRQMIAKALQELDRTDEARVGKRLINGYTIPVDSAKIPEARRRVEAFQQEMTEFLSSGKRNDLYQLNVQLFPLTTSESSTRKSRK